MLDEVNGHGGGGGDDAPDLALRLQQFVLANELAQSRENIVGVAIASRHRGQLRREMERLTGVKRGFGTRDQWEVEGFTIFFVKDMPCDFGVIY